MSDFLNWRHEWQTGIDWIDEDHRQIADLLNQLVEVNECAARGPYPQCPDAAKRELLANMDALIELSRRHYRAEEAFLREIDFPGYNEHRGGHDMQLAEFTELRRTLGQDGRPCLDPETLQGFKRWFFNHVIAEDHDYVDYYRIEFGGGRAARSHAAAGR